MSDYDLYYWPVPFRGQFVRAVLAYAGKTWTEAGAAAISHLMSSPAQDMPVPFMGPPMLIDKKADFAIAQMPAIVLYLGETLDLMPGTASLRAPALRAPALPAPALPAPALPAPALPAPALRAPALRAPALRAPALRAPALRAMTMKIVNDANDVMDEITLDGGREMWTPTRWQDFVPRLKRWMSFWEETGRRHGLKANAGFLLGGEAPGIADVVTATLWSTLADRFPKIEAILEEVAPMTAALTRRVADLPPLAKLAAQAQQDYGDAYCGGQIEASLRKVLGA